MFCYTLLNKTKAIKYKYTIYYYRVVSYFSNIYRDVYVIFETKFTTFVDNADKKIIEHVLTHMHKHIKIGLLDDTNWCQSHIDSDAFDTNCCFTKQTC